MKLKPWYDVVKPREDLREGKPLDASEFAVHLDKVRLGEQGNAPEDYRNPRRFFDRTSLTENLTGLEAQVVGEDYAPLAPGEVGELRYRAPWLPKGYVDNPAASAKHFRGGWFYPGDRGAIDADGWLTLHGRTDDVINFRGVKILRRRSRRRCSSTPRSRMRR